MSKFRIGDTLAFRREVVRKCGHAKGVAEFRGTVTEISGEWVFMMEATGRTRVMPATNMCKVARNGVILELV